MPVGRVPGDSGCQWPQASSELGPAARKGRVPAMPVQPAMAVACCQPTSGWRARANVTVTIDKGMERYSYHEGWLAPRTTDLPVWSLHTTTSILSIPLLGWQRPSRHGRPAASRPAGTSYRPLTGSEAATQ